MYLAPTRKRTTASPERATTMQVTTVDSGFVLLGLISSSAQLMSPDCLSVLAGILLIARYTVLTSPQKDETAVSGCS